MLGRVAFYPTLLYNVMMERFGSREWFTRIDSNTILGALPFRTQTQQVILVEKENVRGVITMNEEFEMRHFVNSSEEWSAVGVAQLCLPTPDLVAAPTQINIQKGVDFLLAHREEGSTVYVHCKAGRTRSATIVAAYLMKLHHWSAEEAVNFIAARRQHISIRKPQWKALQEYHRTCAKHY